MVFQLLEGRENLSDNIRTGRPSAFRNNENLPKVKATVETHRRVTVNMIAEEMGIRKYLGHAGWRLRNEQFVPLSAWPWAKAKTWRTAKIWLTHEINRPLIHQIWSLRISSYSFQSWKLARTEHFLTVQRYLKHWKHQSKRGLAFLLQMYQLRAKLEIACMPFEFQAHLYCWMYQMRYWELHIEIVTLPKLRRVSPLTDSI